MYIYSEFSYKFNYNTSSLVMKEDGTVFRDEDPKDPTRARGKRPTRAQKEAPNKGPKESPKERV